MATPIVGSTARHHISVQGIVQGVGFRPFVYGQALRRGLNGFVFNDGGGVTIEVEGEPGLLEDFRRAIVDHAPPLARIDSITSEQVAPVGDHRFRIADSRAGAERGTLISPDSATCDDCAHELSDPNDRRRGYPFTNCTNCGPRFTIVEDVPYDRANTTMRVFPMCPDCRAEYEDPLNRRFHAQPNACPVCGPQMRLLDAEGAPLGVADPVAEAARQLAEGAILAIKGLGGYHLACDAFNAEAVDRLRARKHREAKPFALIVPDTESARQLCIVSDAEAELLESRRRPIVLLKRRPDCPVAPGVAPAYDSLGIMLPYVPLHHLLMGALTDYSAQQSGTRQSGLDGPLPASKRPKWTSKSNARQDSRLDALDARRPKSVALVMTSGNLSDEPIAYRDDDALERLAPVADGVLSHSRAIHIRCDDSVARIAAGGAQIIRRSRGFAPEPVPLALDCPVPLLACGGHFKNTFCLVKGRQAFVSHHIGDLENLETVMSFLEGIGHFQRLFDIQPQAVAYDLHPEYLSTQHAHDLDVPRKIGVQHHHAHIASVIAEHHLAEPVIGVAADGTGYGSDGAIWGCEVMVADLDGFDRFAHLGYVPLPGGDKAVRQPWRMAVSYLAHTYGDDFEALALPFAQRLDRTSWRTVAQMAARGLNSPATSSLGRLFDAVAALVDVPSAAAGEILYEGQAAIELEMFASGATGHLDGHRLRHSPGHRHGYGHRHGDRHFDRLGYDDRLYPFTIGEGKPAVMDVRPMIRAIVDDVRRGTPVPRIAACFHATLAELLAAACRQAREASGLGVVALSGGVFQNRLLLEQTIARLEDSRFRVYINRRVPPNDGGLCLGQAAVAAALLASEA